MNDKVLLIDTNDNVIAEKDKMEAHLGDGILHRAFSVFIFTRNGELLLQKRSASKLLWPGFWSNSCCSHPRTGESYQEAATRRIREELGMEAKPVPLYNFEYRASYLDVGSEWELCTVLVARSDEPPQFDPQEIEKITFRPFSKLVHDINRNPERYTPWFKMEVIEIQKKYKKRILDLCGVPLL